MRSIIVLSCVVAMTCWVDARPALGQAPAPSAAIAIEIRNNTTQAETCLSAQALSARVAHYSSNGGQAHGLDLILYITAADAAELQIVRAGAVVSRRSFTQLPAPCADRRDAVALSIALALERTAASTPPAAAGGGSATPTRATSRSTPGPSATGGRSSDAAASGTASAGPPRGTSVTEPTADDSTLTDPLANADPDADAAPDLAASADVPAKPPSPRAQPPAQPAEPSTFDNVPTTTSRDPRRKGSNESSLQLHLGGRFSVEAVPVPVWVAALGIELPISTAFTLGITALMSSVGEASLAGARARASFLGLEALGCRNVPLGVFMLQACGGAAVALCEVSGRDFPRERPEATLLWAAVLGRASLRWPRTGSVAARLLVQPHVSINRPDLRVEDSSAHLSSFPVGGSAGAELWLALP